MVARSLSASAACLVALMATAAHAQDAPPAPPKPAAAPSSSGMSEQRKADLKKTVERNKARRAKSAASAARYREGLRQEAVEQDRQSLALAVEEARREAVAFARQVELAKIQATRDLARAVDANTLAARQPAQAAALAPRPMKLSGTLRKGRGGWGIVSFDHILLLQDVSPYEREPWFKDRAEVAAVGTLALAADTPAGQEVPFDLESLKPVGEATPTPPAGPPKAGAPR